MKKSFTNYFKSIALALLLVIGVQTYGQKSHFSVQPDAICGKDALIGNCVPCGYDNTNFGDGQEFNALAWTNNGAISNHRSLLQFDFSSIPIGSTVQTATLHLYYNPASSNASGLHSITSGPNDAYLMKITSPWDEHTVTWNNQPSVSISNEAYVRASTLSNEDYTIDVTALVQDQVNDPTNNYGMMIQLITESYYRCLLFASSDNPNSALHPKLKLIILLLQIHVIHCNWVHAMVLML